MFAQFKPTRNGDFNVYVAKTFRKTEGRKKSSTVIIERLGLLSEIAKAHPGCDPKEWAKQYAAELTGKETEENTVVNIKLNPAKSISSSTRRHVMGGMLPMMPVYHKWLGLDKICHAICEQHKFQYNLAEILEGLTYARILCPDSKLATFDTWQSFIYPPKARLENVYRALEVLSEESDSIQSEIWENTSRAGRRNTGVVYYDCTNYYFETEREDGDMDGNAKGLRKFGHSKEHRPNPIVQLGMFMDADGMPMAFCINPGNTPETQTIVPLEEKLANHFGISKFVCCTDGGLGSRDVRKYNRTEGREYITVQSLKDKKCHPAAQVWALADGGWRIRGREEFGTGTIEEARLLLGDKFKAATLYKDRWFKVGKEDFEERYIVTYSQKYADYQRLTRDQQVQRAALKIQRGQSTTPKSPNDCRRFILTTACTEDGEVARKSLSTINEEKVQAEARFDGFYALATSLDDPVPAILNASGYRAEIEALFRITKTDLEGRPVFLRRRNRIHGHFIMCFIALLLIKKIQKDLPSHHSVEQIIDSLRRMDYLLLEAHGYLPDFDRSDLVDQLQALTKQQLDAEIITKPKMRRIVRELAKE